LVRVCGRKETVLRPRPDKFVRKVRSGYALGLDAKRLIARSTKPGRGMVEFLKQKTKRRVVWKIDGHAAESAEDKERKRKQRLADGVDAKYLRGLQADPIDATQQKELHVGPDATPMKFFSRDGNSSENITTIWIADFVEGGKRDLAFVRPPRSGKQSAKSRR
jgi:hypothetical protein